MAFETRFVEDMPAADYFADPCDVPSLSSSIANVLDYQSPAHAWSRHPRLGGVARRATKSLEDGSLTHALLLGSGKGIKVVDAPDFRTKAAQVIRDQARLDGEVPVLTKDYESATKTAETIRQRMADVGIVLSGKRELTAFWTETTESGAKVQCRGQMDHVELPIVHDIKSIRSAHPLVCRRHVESYGYSIQRAAYVSAVEHIRPDLAGRVDFIFVFYEIEPPFAVTPVRLSGAFRELGERAWQRAVGRWEECLRTNTWPAYADKVIEIEPSPGALSRDLERELILEGAA